MMVIPEIKPPQRITRLTPLRDVLALVETRVDAVRSERCSLASASGHVLAEDVVAPLLPSSAVALRDGFAVEAAATTDASPYAPTPFTVLPARVDVGDRLPEGADAVMPFDALMLRGDHAEAIASVSPGEGMLMPGADATRQIPLRLAGEKVRSTDIAVMAAAGLGEVTIRVPRIRIVCSSAATTPILDAALDMLVRFIVSAGARGLDTREDLKRFDTALTDSDFDAAIAVGGTGSGRKDDSVRTFAQLGRVEAHGVAMSPGETAAFGFAGARPVLLVPGRIDATLAIWLLIGRYLIAKLSGGTVEDMPVMLPLKRKVTSTIGLAELIPVGCSGGMAEPLASGYLSLAALARSDGWIVVPADSEGFAAGTPVAVRSWP